MMDRYIMDSGINKIAMGEEGKSISMVQFMKDIGVIIYHMEKGE